MKTFEVPLLNLNDLGVANLANCESQANIDEVTKVQLEYPLVRPFADADAPAIASVHGWYGILRVKLAPRLDHVSVEYDASRLSEKDVEAVLHRFAIPIRRQFTV